jgi:hypothetical protein
MTSGNARHDKATGTRQQPTRLKTSLLSANNQALDANNCTANAQFNDMRIVPPICAALHPPERADQYPTGRQFGGGPSIIRRYVQCRQYCSASSEHSDPQSGKILKIYHFEDLRDLLQKCRSADYSYALERLMKEKFC